MAKNSPLISVLICNYNYDKYIEDALDSVLMQDYENIEIIIIDDGSRDNSVAVIERFISEHPEAKVQLKAKKINQGACYARNDALDLAAGEYILFLDSDDTLPAQYVSTFYGVALDHNADVVYGDVRMFGDESSQTNYPKFSQKKLLAYNYVNISSLAKTSSIGAHRFDVKLNQETLEDYDFWLGLALKKLKFVKAEGVYLNYRIQNKSRNNNSVTPDKRILRFVEVWKYSLDKYRSLIGDRAYEDALINELEYRVKEIGGELIELNDIVHKELLPELKVRADYIEVLDGRIEAANNYNRTLESTIQQMQESLTYRATQTLKKPARLLKKAFKK